ncbi:MAG: hypothetical protein QM758_13705 [Armatimonas sp.]
MRQDRDTKDTVIAETRNPDTERADEHPEENFVDSVAKQVPCEDIQGMLIRKDLVAFAHALNENADADLDTAIDAVLSKIAPATDESSEIQTHLTLDLPEDQEEVSELERVAGLAFNAVTLAANAPDVTSLGELRAQAYLDLDDVAEETGLLPETIDALEEEPVVDTPSSLLHKLGTLFGYSASQIDSILRSQGAQGQVAAAYKLRRGAGATDGTTEGTTSPRTFAEILRDTGGTPEQEAFWFSTVTAATSAINVVEEMESNIFA